MSQIKDLPGTVFIWLDGAPSPACQINKVSSVEMDMLDVALQIGLNPAITYIVHGLLEDTGALVTVGFRNVTGIMVLRDQGVLRFTSPTVN